MDKTYDTPTEVTAEDGKVVLDGPDGVDVTITPQAAETTSERLLSAAMEAHGQKVRKEADQRERVRRHPA